MLMPQGVFGEFPQLIRYIFSLSFVSKDSQSIYFTSFLTQPSIDLDVRKDVQLHTDTKTNLYCILSYVLIQHLIAGCTFGSLMYTPGIWHRSNH